MSCARRAVLLLMFFHIHIHAVLGHFETSTPFSGQAFKAPLLCHCIIHVLYMHLAFCILHVPGGQPEDKVTLRARDRSVHISCFIPSL